jgi:hypothetical protein
VKPDLVRTDDNWDDNMAALIDEIRKWLSRHKVDPGETRKEGSWFTSKGGGNEAHVELGNKCRSRGCVKCRARHHTSLCHQENNSCNPVFTGHTSPVEGQTLPPMIPINIKGATLWAYSDSGFSRIFI